jgi:hypothetical protein
VSAIRATGLGSVRARPGPSRNGLPGVGYVYQGTGADRLEPPPRWAAGSRRERQPEVSVRALAALAALGGEASTTEIRTAVELDGGPAFEPQYLITVLGRLARRDPPRVTQCGRERSGRGRTARWRLGPGAGGAA